MPALWMTAFMRPILLTGSAIARVSVALARSPMTTPAERGATSVRAESRCDERACRTTSWPSVMSVRAAASPRPSVEPVMKRRLISDDNALTCRDWAEQSDPLLGAPTPPRLALCEAYDERNPIDVGKH